MFLYLENEIQAYNSIRFKNIGVVDGLKMGSISGVQQDAQGFIWIATADGLYRYDGIKLIHFNKTFEANKPSLSDSYITGIAINDDILFIGYHNGAVDAFHTKSFGVLPINFNPNQNPKKDIIASLKVFNNILWISTEGDGIWTYDINEGTDANRFQNQIDVLKQIRVFEIINQDTFLASDNSLYILSKNNFTQINLTEKNLAVNDIVKYNDTFFVATYIGLFYIDENQELVRKSVKIRSRRSNLINKLLVSADNELWMGTEGGVVIYKNGKTELHENDLTNNYTLCNDKIQNLYEDNDRTIWVGTISGLSRYSPILRKFGLISEFEYRDTLYGNNVYMMYPSKNGEIWVGTLNAGLFIFNEDFTIKENFYYIQSGDIITRAVRSFLIDSKGRHWVGTRDEGVFLLDIQKKSFSLKASTSNSILSSNVIRHLYEDKNGIIWISTANGLFYFDENLELHQANLTFSNQESLKNVYQIIEDPKNGNLFYIALFRGGIKVYDKKRDRVTKHFSTDSHPDGILSDNVMCLTWLNNDTLLFGTYGGGCGIFNVRKNVFQSFTVNNGAPDNVVYGIIYDTDGKAWMSTNNGIAKWNIYSGVFKSFKMQHYIQNLEYNEGAFCKTENGLFLFGGITGFNYFNPSNISFNTQSKPIFITDIRAKYTYRTKDKLKLDYTNSRLEIDFAALYLTDPSSVNYRFKLKGHDEEWQVPFYENTAYYPKIAPGTYSFLIEAQDEFGMWKSTFSDFTIVVIPPLYQRWWFIALITLLVGGIIYFIFRIQTQKLKETHKLQMVNSELRAIRSQLNPHFIFNSLNSIQYFILNKEPKEAYKYLSKFAVLMRKILQNSRVRYVSLFEEIESLDLYLELEKLRLDQNLEYSISTENVSPEQPVYIPTMLTQPFIENAIIHGLLPLEDDRKLKVTFILQKEYMQIEIEDNGVGLEQAKKNAKKRKKLHQSAGLELSKKRLEILSDSKHHYGFELISMDIGVKVVLKVPYLDHEPLVDEMMEV